MLWYEWFYLIWQFICGCCLLIFLLKSTMALCDLIRPHTGNSLLPTTIDRVRIICMENGSKKYLNQTRIFSMEKIKYDKYTSGVIFINIYIYIYVHHAEKLISIILNFETNLWRITLQKFHQYIVVKLLINGPYITRTFSVTKPETPCRISVDIREFHDNKSNPVFDKKIQGLKHPWEVCRYNITSENGLMWSDGPGF